MTDKQLAEKIEGIKINFDRKIYSDNEMFWVDLKEEIKKLVEEVERKTFIEGWTIGYELGLEKTDKTN